MKRLATKCAVCEWRYECSNKRFETVGYYSIAEQAQQRYAEPIASKILVKHDYRHIKVAENTTVTIDLEDIKRELHEQLSVGYLLREG
jgi:hypothetical protein